MWQVVGAKAIKLVDRTKRDNAKVANVQVTNVSPQAIEIRILVNSDSTCMRRSARTVDRIFAAGTPQGLTAITQRRHWDCKAKTRMMRRRD